MKLGLFNLAAGAACILVGIQAAELWSAPTGLAALPAQAAAVQEPPRTERLRFEAPEVALFAEIANRPLFSHSIILGGRPSPRSRFQRRPRSW